MQTRLVLPQHDVAFAAASLCHVKMQDCSRSACCGAKTGLCQVSEVPNLHLHSLLFLAATLLLAPTMA